VSEITNLSPTVNFSSLYPYNEGIIIPDNCSKTLSLYATFKPTVADNEQIQFTGTNAISKSFNSGFYTANAGGAETPIAGDDNRIEVNASQLVFYQNTSDVNHDISPVMTPFPSIRALDSNANLDKDFNSIVNLSVMGSVFNPNATISVAADNGIATFSNLSFNEEASDAKITASSSRIQSVLSESFKILNPTLSLNNLPVEQTFDIYPNPTSNGNIFVRSNGSNRSNIELKLYNLLGQVVLKTSGTLSNNEVIFDISNIKSGLYVTEINQNNKKFISKLIVK
jgi:hypothetical protein